jgi:hypothetical protein
MRQVQIHVDICQGRRSGSFSASFRAGASFSRCQRIRFDDARPYEAKYLAELPDCRVSITWSDGKPLLTQRCSRRSLSDMTLIQAAAGFGRRSYIANHISHDAFDHIGGRRDGAVLGLHSRLLRYQSAVLEDYRCRFIRNAAGQLQFVTESEAGHMCTVASAQCGRTQSVRMWICDVERAPTPAAGLDKGHDRESDRFGATLRQQWFPH